MKVEEVKTEIAPPRVDSCLTWIQAAPMAALSRKNPDHVTRFDYVDFLEEQNVMHQVFQAAGGAEFQFEIGTPARIGTIMQELSCANLRHGANLHWSCHGTTEYLALEDGWGNMIPLTAPVLKEWLRPVSSKIRFVFVAACKSFSLTKQAVIEAGIKHAICSFSDETDLNVSYVMEFSRVFYSALLHSLTLQQAFDLATNQLAVHPSFRTLKPQLRLLPECTTRHQVTIFPPGKGSAIRRMPRIRPSVARFPQPPGYFVRHDIDVWRILQSLLETRMVWVTGTNHVGKTTTVKMACRCMQQRLQSNRFDGIVWKELHADATDRQHQGIFSVPLRDLESIEDRKMLVVLDTKHIPSHSMGIFVDHMSKLLMTTNNVRFLIIHSRRLDLKLNYISREVQVSRLGLESTVKLFGKFCDHVNQNRAPFINSPASLWKKMTEFAPGQGKNEMSMLQLPRYRALYKGLGNGYPRSIINAAKAMSSEASVSDYLRYVSLGYFHELDTRQSRCSLLCLKLELLSDIYQALRVKRYAEARVLQSRLGTVSLVLDEFEPLSTMIQELTNLREKVLKAVASSSMTDNVELVEEKHRIEAKIRRAATFIARRDKKNYSVVLDIDFCCQQEKELDSRSREREEMVTHFLMLNGAASILPNEEECISRSVLGAKIDEDWKVMSSLQSRINACLDETLREKPASVTGTEWQKSQSQDQNARTLAASRIQAMVRLYLARSRVATMRQRVAAIRIQRWMRNYLWIQSIVRVQARVRGVLYRINEEKQRTDSLREKFKLVRALMNTSLKRLACRRQVCRRTTGSADTWPYDTAFMNDGGDSLCGSVNTSTTDSLSELSSSAQRSLQDSVDFFREMGSRAKDRLKSGMPPREVRLSKPCRHDDEMCGDRDITRSRWLPGGARHRSLRPNAFHLSPILNPIWGLDDLRI
eukprot:scaffold3572_cov113-Cylindrotheca_fusiformis.AAC.5